MSTAEMKAASYAYSFSRAVIGWTDTSYPRCFNFFSAATVLDLKDIQPNALRYGDDMASVINEKFRQANTLAVVAKRAGQTRNVQSMVASFTPPNKETLAVFQEKAPELAALYL